MGISTIVVKCDKTTKHLSAGLEVMKEKLKHMDSMQKRIADLTARLNSTESTNNELQKKIFDSESMSDQLRLDMQQVKHEDI